MAILHSQDSAYAQERRKHEALHSEYGAPGRPYVFFEYPTMMYKAGLDDHGKVAVIDKEIAETEVDRAKYERLGYVFGGQAAAITAFEKQRQELAVLAAQRNYEDRNMGDKAKAERDGVESRSSEHLGAIPPAHPKTGRRD